MKKAGTRATVRGQGLAGNRWQVIKPDTAGEQAGEDRELLGRRHHAVKSQVKTRIQIQDRRIAIRWAVVIIGRAIVFRHLRCAHFPLIPAG